MARCHSCSAPLLANINRCRYCNVRNDVDLHGKHQYDVATRHSDRVCPHCELALQTIKLDLKKPFYIEQCKSCFGLFFDLGEIETLLDSSVSNVFNINLELIKNINKDRYQKNKIIKYIKCPVCQSFMKRVNFGHRSGVIIDQCHKHGIWVDSGEVTHLLEWKKAGGELLNSKKQAQANNKNTATQSKSSNVDPLYGQQSHKQDVDLINTVSSLVFKLFT